ncbi:MAG TPA: metallophosphoesterase [Gemmatimonadales bacterium]|nr:metallophosphoesterase [Gemmatimonadales bacterium]
MPDSRLIVLADAHIGRAPPASEAALLAFLADAPSLGDALLVVGDLFEFWFAYGRAIPRRGFPVAAALARLATIIPVSMVGGNHDRWGKGFWAEDVGIAYSRRELLLSVGSRRVLAVHGDGLSERPGRSAWTHRIVGHPLTSAAFGLLHPDLGLRLVDRLSFLLSPAQTPVQQRRHAETQRRWAEAKLSASPEIGALVMGHSHIAAVTEPAPGRLYLNPGAWFDGNRYALLTEHGAELRTFTPAAPPPLRTAAPR